MRVDRYRIPCYLDVVFKVEGTTLEFVNPLTKDRYLPILTGKAPGRFSSYIAKDHFPENEPRREPNELTRLAELEIDMFLKRILTLENQYDPNMKITVISVELSHNEDEHSEVVLEP